MWCWSSEHIFQEAKILTWMQSLLTDDCLKFLATGNQTCLTFRTLSSQLLKLWWQLNIQDNIFVVENLEEAGKNILKVTNFHIIFYVTLFWYVGDWWIVTNCCICRICLMAGFPTRGFSPNFCQICRWMLIQVGKYQWPKARGQGKLGYISLGLRRV